MSQYTVVILKPDYNNGEYSSRHYIAYTTADSVETAEHYAKIIACSLDIDNNGHPVNGRADDYLVLCTFNHHLFPVTENDRNTNQWHPLQGGCAAFLHPKASRTEL